MIVPSLDVQLKSQSLLLSDDEEVFLQLGVTGLISGTMSSTIEVLAYSLTTGAGSFSFGESYGRK